MYCNYKIVCSCLCMRMRLYRHACKSTANKAQRYHSWSREYKVLARQKSHIRVAHFWGGIKRYHCSKSSRSHFVCVHTHAFLSDYESMYAFMAFVFFLIMCFENQGDHESLRIPIFIRCELKWNLGNDTGVISCCIFQLLNLLAPKARESSLNCYLTYSWGVVRR